MSTLHPANHPHRWVDLSSPSRLALVIGHGLQMTVHEPGDCRGPGKRRWADTDHHVLSVVRVQFRPLPDAWGRLAPGSDRTGRLLQEARATARDEPLRSGLGGAAVRDGGLWPPGWPPVLGPGGRYAGQQPFMAGYAGLGCCCGRLRMVLGGLGERSGPAVPAIVVGADAKHLRQRPQRREHQVLYPDGC